MRLKGKRQKRQALSPKASPVRGPNSLFADLCFARKFRASRQAHAENPRSRAVLSDGKGELDHPIQYEKRTLSRLSTPCAPAANASGSARQESCQESAVPVSIATPFCAVTWI